MHTLKILIAKRNSRSITNMEDLITHPKLANDPRFMVRQAHLGEGEFSTAGAQMRLFADADVYIASHGRYPSFALPDEQPRSALGLWPDPSTGNHDTACLLLPHLQAPHWPTLR